MSTVKHITHLINKFIIGLISVSCLAFGSCSNNSTGTKQTVISQTGSNKAFPTNKHARVKNKIFRSDKSAVRSKQREHANYQGNDAGRQ
ncbi:MAG: hypothetical protein H7329_05985 [Opitutaceae bacterium]|nr:hypothetical protein [Cytophagales bacterium]